MTLASWYLVTLEDADEKSRAAGITYLVASQIGTVCLLALLRAARRPCRSRSGDGRAGFRPLRRTSRGVRPPRPSSSPWSASAPRPASCPLHVWLPEAHPAAPSPRLRAHERRHDQDGDLRARPHPPDPRAAAGVVGLDAARRSGSSPACSACSSPWRSTTSSACSPTTASRTSGIIASASGSGSLGATPAHRPRGRCSGFAGALLHVLNHALFKGLLFLGAGSVLHATGTREIDRLGGLLQAHARHRGRRSSSGAVAICGLPPLNGFVSEFLVLSAARCARSSPPAPRDVLAGAAAPSVRSRSSAGSPRPASPRPSASSSSASRGRADADRARGAGAGDASPRWSASPRAASASACWAVHAVRLVSAPRRSLAGLEPRMPPRCSRRRVRPSSRAALIAASGRAAGLAVLAAVSLRSCCSRREVGTPSPGTAATRRRPPGCSTPRPRSPRPCSACSAGCSRPRRASAAPQDLFPADRPVRHRTTSTPSSIASCGPRSRPSGAIAALLRRLQHGRLQLVRALHRARAGRAARLEAGVTA